MSKPKTVVINGRFLSQPVTGVQRYARELLREFDQILPDRPDLRIRLVTPTSVGSVPELRHISHQAVGHLHGHAWEQLELPAHVRGDILFCPGNTVPMISLYGRSRVVATLHDLSHIYFPEAYRKTYRLLYSVITPMVLRRASTVITVSESEKREILQRYPGSAGRVIAIQNGSIPGGADLVEHTPSADRFVLYVGSLSKRKNFDGLINVATHLARKRGLRFVFVGSTPGFLANAGVKIAEDVMPRIQFEGQVDSWEVLRRYYQSASCFFFPSFYEASPLPPLEAMACGCPVVASHIPSLTERCGDAAVYCDPTSIESMAASIEELLDNPARESLLRQLGYERARKFTWRGCAEMTLDAICG